MSANGYITRNNGIISYPCRGMDNRRFAIDGYEDVLLYTRNKNWIPIMEEKMKAHKTFFAVGAGHLGGKNGVIDLLKKAGYKLTPLSQSQG